MEDCKVHTLAGYHQTVSQSPGNSSSSYTAAADQSAVVAAASTSGYTAITSQSPSDFTATSDSAAVISQSPADTTTSTSAGMASHWLDGWLGFNGAFDTN